MNAEIKCGSPTPDRCVLHLHVAAHNAKSPLASANIKRISAAYRDGGYDIQAIGLIVDLHPAAKDQLLATPTLGRLLPAPARRMIGDLPNTEKVRLIPDTQPKDAP